MNKLRNLMAAAGVTFASVAISSNEAVSESMSENNNVNVGNDSYYTSVELQLENNFDGNGGCQNRSCGENGGCTTH